MRVLAEIVLVSQEQRKSMEYLWEDSAPLPAGELSEGKEEEATTALWEVAEAAGITCCSVTSCLGEVCGRERGARTC